MDHDGARDGFALDIIGEIAREAGIPVIASGGAGKAIHFAELFESTKVTAALAAGIFHFKELNRVC